MRRIIPLVLGVATLTSPISAQQRLFVGDTKVDARRLPAGTEHFDMVVAVEGREQPLGTYSVTVHPPASADGPLLVTQLTRFAQGTIIDSAWVDARTLAPRRQVSLTPKGRTEFVFDGRRVRGVRPTEAGGDPEVNETLPSAPFSGSLAQVMIRALPLSPGFVAEIPLYSDPGGFVEGRVEVLAQEELHLPGGNARQALRIALSVGATQAMVWIDPVTGQELRTESTYPGGSTFIMTPSRPSSDTLASNRDRGMESCAALPGVTPSDWLGRARKSMGMHRGEVLRFKSVHRWSMNFQSDRPDPPFFSSFDVMETWFDPASGLDRTLSSTVYPGGGHGTPRGSLTDRRSAWVETPGGIREVPRLHATSLSRRMANPWAVIFDWMARSQEVRVVGACQLRGERRVTLELPGANGPERLFLDEVTAQPVAVTRTQPHSTWGQRDEQLLWSTWFQVADSAFVPGATHLLADGEVEFERTLGEVEVMASEAAALPSLPTEIAGGEPADPWLEALTATVPDTIRVTPDVFVLAHPVYNNVLVRVADTVFVLDATISEARARQDSAWAARLFPDSPHRVLIVTDLAWPHIGGVRFWVARGAHVVSHRWSEPFLRRLLDRRWTLEPDVLERERAVSGVSLAFTPVDDVATLAGGSLVLTGIDGRGAEGAIAVFVPPARFLWAGDFVQTIQEGSLYAKDVMAAMSRFDLHPRLVAAQHLPLTSWSEVVDANTRPWHR